MTGAEFKRIREKLGFTCEAWGRALGYSGENTDTQVRKMQSGAAKIRPEREKLVRMYERFGVPDDLK